MGGQRHGYERDVRYSAFNHDIGGWAVQSVTDMAWMFEGASSFNQDISGWAVTSVTNMDYRFTNALAFDRDIGDWAVHSVRNMGWMFNGASAFNQDLGWCLDEDVDFDPWGDGLTFQGAFEGTPCEATSCGVAVCAPTPAPTTPAPTTPAPMPAPTPAPTTPAPMTPCADDARADACSDPGRPGQRRRRGPLRRALPHLPRRRARLGSQTPPLRRQRRAPRALHERPPTPPFVLAF